VSARVEEWGQLLGGLVTPGDIWPLIRVAMEAGKREIAGNRGSVVLSGDDVIDLEWDRTEILRHAAIFTGAPGTGPHEIDERLIHDCFPRTLFLPHFFECSPGLGVKNAEQTAGIGEAEELLALAGC
jgi:hypothetical protein